MMNFSSLKQMEPKKRNFFVLCLVIIFAVFFALLWQIGRVTNLMNLDMIRSRFDRSVSGRPGASDLQSLSSVSGVIVEKVVRKEIGGNFVRVSVPKIKSETVLPGKGSLYAFFLSDSETEGAKEVSVGSRVEVFFYGEPSEESHRKVEKIILLK